MLRKLLSKRLETDHSIKPDLQTNIWSGSKEDKEALRKTDLRMPESLSRYKQYRRDYPKFAGNHCHQQLPQETRHDIAYRLFDVF